MTHSSDDDIHNRRLEWGLNLDRPEVTTQEEIDAFREISAKQLGVQQDGLDYWLDAKPEVLKRYRLWADSLRVRDADEAPNKWNPTGITNQYVYALTGFEDGVRYQFLVGNRFMTKEQYLEQVALVFRYAGPRGMATLGRVAQEHVWHEPPQPCVWPAGWGPDPEAFRSGADFHSRVASDDDVRKILEWYERVLGEVPAHVSFLADVRPDLLKASRARYENTLRLLPKQTEPWALLQISMLRGFAGGVREALLLGRAFGISKPQILEAISWGTFYGGDQSLELVAETGREILDAWPA